MQKIENIDQYKIVHIIPDVTEEEKKAIRRDISQKIYNLISNKISKGLTQKYKTNYNVEK